MILEVQLPISRFHLPRVLNLSSCNALLRPRLPPDVQRLADDDYLRHANCPQAKRVAQRVGRSAVDLARHDARAVAQRLLEPDGRRAAVVRRDVDVEPAQVYTRSNVGGYGAEERAEEFDRIGYGREYDRVADDPDKVG